MIKILYIIFLSLIVANCSIKKVVKHHGVPFLEKKQTSLVVNESNKNDIRKILGNPSTISKFDNNIWMEVGLSRKPFDDFKPDHRKGIYAHLLKILDHIKLFHDAIPFKLVHIYEWLLLDLFSIIKKHF